MLHIVVILMAFDPQKVIQIALAEVGYLEKATNSNLDDKTANAGSNNFTKYARDLDNTTGFYNGKKQGFAWCDCFVDWCFVQAYGALNAKNLLCQPDYSAGAGCLYSARYYQARKQFFTSPKVGDQIFFGNATSCVHTGIVYAVDANRVYTVEGNTSGASGVIANGGGVCKKSYSINYSGIYGFGRPNYGQEVIQKPTESTTAVPTAQTDKTCTITAKVLQKGCKGLQVKLMQTALKVLGYDIGVDGADGDFGNNTLNAVLRFQKDKNLEADGICGTNTWNMLLN